MHITISFNAYSIIKLFSSSIIFVERRIFGLGKDFVFKYISLTNSLLYAILVYYTLTSC